MSNQVIPYTLRIENIEGIPHFFVSYTDKKSITRETEVSRPIYLEFYYFLKNYPNNRPDIT